MSSVREGVIDLKDVEQLRARFRGALLRSGEEGYDEARRIWNGAIDRRPALIACGKRRARVIERTCKLLAAGAEAITFSCGIGAVLSVVLAWGGHEGPPHRPEVIACEQTAV